MKSKEIREYLIGLIEEYKNGIIDKDTVYDRAEALVSDNELECSEDENLKCVLEHILPDACLLYIDEPGDERKKKKIFMNQCVSVKNYLSIKARGDVACRIILLKKTTIFINLVLSEKLQKNIKKQY